MKRAFLWSQGIIFLLLSAGCAFMAINFLLEGAGLQFIGPIFSSFTVLVGVAQFSGFVFGAAIFFAVGTLWCAEATVPRSKN